MATLAKDHKEDGDGDMEQSEQMTIDDLEAYDEGANSEDDYYQ